MAYGARQYQSGRGYSGSGQQRQRGQGFWVGRPEFGGAPSNYNRMEIRPLTVARGDPDATLRVAGALAHAGKEFYNYKKRGGAEGVRQRIEQGGEAFARGIRPDLRNAPAPEPGAARDPGIFDEPDPFSRITPGIGSSPTAPVQPAAIDWDKVDQYLGVGVNAAKKVAANPTVQAAAKGAVKGAVKGSVFGVGGMVAGAAKGAARGARSVSAEDHTRGPATSLDPFGGDDRTVHSYGTWNTPERADELSQNDWQMRNPL